MTLLLEAFKNKKFDVRLIERQLRNGLLKQAELEKNKHSLQDDAEHGIWVSIKDIQDSSEEALGLF